VDDHRPGSLLGLFAGGSLRTEAATIVAASLGPVADVEEAKGHRLVDLGADRYTVGRAHPMIDQSIRIDRLEAAVDDHSLGVVLLDVVLGYGAHPDPAAELAPSVAMATHGGMAVVASLCGTDRDPQDRGRQAAILNEAGAAVYSCNAAAAEAAVALVATVPA
jgi:FdrA protein